jgi:ribosomal protein S19
VYNGKEFKKVFITGAKIGFKFGEFVFTRTYTQKYKAVIKKK